MEKIFLTSSMGNYKKINDIRVPSVIDNTNFMLDKLMEICDNNKNILLVASDPLAYDKNDEMLNIMKESFDMSGIKYKNMLFLDERNEKEIGSLLLNSDIVILMGGHLPTQNKWFNKINLKNKIKKFNGYLIGQSAGSMNCACNVYACPEYENELDENNYPRWIEGLSLTDINIFPHFDKYKDVMFGNLKMIDIVINDSYNNPIYALNDGAYIEIFDGSSIIYGECFKIVNGIIKKICNNKENVKLI